jgi:hypothetical protein
MGSNQAQDYQSHAHSGSTAGAGAHSHSTNFSSVVTQPGGNETPGGGGRGQYQNISINGVGDHAHSFTTNASGGTETRPRNIALLGCIKT